MILKLALRLMVELFMAYLLLIPFTKVLFDLTRMSISKGHLLQDKMFKLALLA